MKGGGASGAGDRGERMKRPDIGEPVGSRPGNRANVVHKPRLLSDNGSSYISGALAEWLEDVNGGAKLVHPGGAKLVHLTLCGTRCWGVVPVVHRRDPRCFE